MIIFTSSEDRLGGSALGQAISWSSPWEYAWPNSRAYCQMQLARLPEPYQARQEPPRNPVKLSPGLQDLQSSVAGKLQQHELGES